MHGNYIYESPTAACTEMSIDTALCEAVQAQDPSSDLAWHVL